MVNWANNKTKAIRKYLQHKSSENFHIFINI